MAKDRKQQQPQLSEFDFETIQTQIERFFVPSKADTPICLILGHVKPSRVASVRIVVSINQVSSSMATVRQWC